MWERSPADMKAALARHDEILRSAITSRGGSLFKYVGDAVYAAFADADDAVGAAFDAQGAMHGERWPDATPIRVRVVLHTGPAERLETDYVGATLNRCARILDLARGGQTLLSMETRRRLRRELPEGAVLIDLAAHRLRDLALPERIFQLRLSSAADDAAPLLAAAERPSNLPARRSTLVGRQGETAEVIRLLDTTSLLTLTGVGGIGKSRLALHVAGQLLDRYPDGVWVASMEPLEEAALVPQRVATELGLSAQAGLTYMESLLAYVRNRHLLLVLDDCEHLVEACATLVGAVLQAGPEVKVIVTSREALEIEPEVVWQVPPLSLPAPDHMGQLRGATLAAYVRGYEAPQLFEDRARGAAPTFRITAGNAVAVAEVCGRLDGVPLAIELAAARLKVMSVDQVLERLGDRFSLLTDGRRDVPARQQTLRGLIDWSFGLLTDDERELFTRLAVFRGGWSLEAAEAVCSDDSVRQDDVLELLTRLVAKSLVRVRDAAGGVRYVFLHTIQEYAWQTFIVSPTEDAVHRRFATWFLEVAEDTATKLSGPDQAAVLDRLELERFNLRASFAWALRIASESGDEFAAEVVYRLAAALVHYWMNRGHLNEGREYLERVLALPPNTVAQTYRAPVCVGAGLLASQQGDLYEARRRANEGLSLFYDAGDKAGMARAMDVLSLAAQQQGDYPAAQEYTEASLSLHEATGDRSGVATAHHLLGQLAWQRGQLDTAGERLQRSLALRRDMGDDRGIAVSLNALAALSYARGDLEEANELFMESLELVRHVGDRRSMGLVLHNLGELAFEQGNLAGARPLLEDSLQVKREVGDRRGEANTLTTLGGIALAEGDRAEGARLLRLGLEMRRALEDHVGIAESLETFASYSLAGAESAKSARLLGAAAALRWQIGAPVKGHEERVNEVTLRASREVLGEARFAAEWAAGRETPWQAAVALALGDTALAASDRSDDAVSGP